MNLSSTTALTDFTPKTEAKRRSLLTPLDKPGHFLLVLDNSSLEKFTTCPKSAEYYLVDEREAQARNSALVFGGAVHAGLEKYLLAQYHAGKPLNEFSVVEAYESWGVAAQDGAIVQHFVSNPSPPDYRSPEVALELLRHYRVRATLPDFVWTILSDASGPIIERAFELPLGVVEVEANINMPWLTKEEQHKQMGSWSCQGEGNIIKVSHIHIAWSGRIDALAFANGLNRVIDHKTTSIMGDNFAQDFLLSNQVLGYVWAAQQLWPERNVLGFCVNALHLKKPGVTGGYPNGLMSPGPRGGPPPLDFLRFYFDYTQERLAWWEENVKSIVSDLIHCLVRRYWPSHTKNCFNKYGQCSYHKVCAQDSAALRQQLIQSPEFKLVTWNPTANRT